MIRWWPRAMLGQTLAVLVPLLAVSQVFTFLLWMTFIQGPRIDDAATLMASQILQADRLLGLLPETDRTRGLMAMRGVEGQNLTASESEDAIPGDFAMRRFFRGLAAKLPEHVKISWQRAPSRGLLVQLRPDDKLWVTLYVQPAENHFDTFGLLLMLLSLAAFPTLGAYLIHRRIERPLSSLAKAAQAVERGQWPDAVAVQGPREIAQVTEAFNQMTATLINAESTRTELLAGISHDIRTPLTKLRMVIASPESFDAPAASAERFVQDIDAIVGQFIDLARGDDEVALLTDLNVMIDQLVSDYAGLGHNFDRASGELPRIVLRPISIQRLLMNLMQNAVLYGREGLRVRTWVETDAVAVSIEDGGPGIPESGLELMKKPFRRGAKVNVKGGTGLGLAIVDRIARQHCGSLELGRSDSGGLQAVVRLKR